MTIKPTWETPSEETPRVRTMALAYSAFIGGNIPQSRAYAEMAGLDVDELYAKSDEAIKAVLLDQQTKAVEEVDTGHKLDEENSGEGEEPELVKPPKRGRKKKDA